MSVAGRRFPLVAIGTQATALFADEVHPSQVSPYQTPGGIFVRTPSRALCHVQSFASIAPASSLSDAECITRSTQGPVSAQHWPVLHSTKKGTMESHLRVRHSTLRKYPRSNIRLPVRISNEAM